MAGKLKAVDVGRLKPGTYGDGGGLYLVVQDSGTRSWILRTMVRGKRCEIGLGSFTTTTLAQARDKGSELRSKARNNVDVLAERRAAKQAEQHENSIPTFKEAAIEFHNNLK